MRILICGSRGWHDVDPIRDLLLGMKERYGDKLMLIQGDCPDGADRIAKMIARNNHIRCVDEPADWEKHGKAAGPIRNSKMLADYHPQVVYAFRASGKSNGTDDMVKKSRAANVPTYVVTTA